MLPVPTSAWMGHKANSVSEIFGRSQLVLYGVVVQENQFTIDLHQAVATPRHLASEQSQLNDALRNDAVDCD